MLTIIFVHLFIIFSLADSSIYHAVNEDLKNLIVSVNTTVEAYESTEGVIPCRPTINGVSIDLVDQHGYMVRNKARSWSYDPLKGFAISFTMKEDEGIYECSAWTQNKKETIRFEFIVKSKPPTIRNSSDVELYLSEFDDILLFCEVEDFPIPEFEWFKDNRNITKGEKTYISGNSSLEILNATETDSGIYTCLFRNEGGSVKKDISVYVGESPMKNWIIIVINVGVGLAIICLVISIYYGYRKIIQIKKRPEKFSFLRNRTTSRKDNSDGSYILPDSFVQGNPSFINPGLPIDQQIDLLPYDQRWEFSKDKLTMGTQLGAGAFGRVVKAEAVGILESEAKTTVAVKMIKSLVEPFRSMGLKSLLDELKIMVHMGSHLNVVNLLGACTLNTPIDKILVIFEYCQHGSVLDYLEKNQKHFISTAEAENLNIDIRGYKPSQRKFENNKGPFILDRHNTTSATSNSSGKSSHGRDNATLKKEKDRKSSSHSLCTADLICWSFQIARGMRFLANRKILHGDLAARNVLLTGNNIVKIADFGLARDIYLYGKYEKKAEGPLPIKWMAIESLDKGVFSIQSDVWSFGIVLWEIFSLGRRPYACLQNKEILPKLLTGDRLEKPEFATDQIYDIMRDCWSKLPDDRPNFESLTERFNSLLNISFRELFDSLDNEYVEWNSSMRRADYLSIMPPVEYVNVESRKLDPTNAGIYDYSVLKHKNGSNRVKEDECLLIGLDDSLNQISTQYANSSSNFHRMYAMTSNLEMSTLNNLYSSQDTSSNHIYLEIDRIQSKSTETSSRYTNKVVTSRL